MNNITIKMNEAAVEELRHRAIGFLEILADEIKETAKGNAPVKTGALRDSIDVFNGIDETEKYIGSKTIPYAIFQELGTVNMDDNAYLVPALDEVIKRK